MCFASCHCRHCIPLLAVITCTIVLLLFANEVTHRHDTAVPSPPPATHDPLTPVTLLRSPVAATSPVRQRYAALSAHYLRHLRQSPPVPRARLHTLLLDTPSACTACLLVQVRQRRVFVYDPRAVRFAMAPFRAQRLHDALFFIRSAVARGVVDDFELVLSVMDAVATTCVAHPHRLPAPRGDCRNATPVFAPVACGQLSTDIPFPLSLGDVLRRGIVGAAVGAAVGATPSTTATAAFAPASAPADDPLQHSPARWDAAMQHVAHVCATHTPWRHKRRRAIFRGSVRLSASVRRVDLVDAHCTDAGRTALLHAARRLRDAARARARGAARGMGVGMWRVWGGRGWVERGVDDNLVLDVGLSGTCGGEIHTMKRLDVAQLMGHKMTVHAEGNGFWADRLLLSLFGGSAVLKQTTPCGMFFEPLMQPFRHYVPVDATFQTVGVMAAWGVANDEALALIVRNARQFAAQFLSQAGVQTYVDEILKAYVGVLETRDFEVFPGAVEV